MAALRRNQPRTFPVLVRQGIAPVANPLQARPTPCRRRKRCVSCMLASASSIPTADVSEGVAVGVDLSGRAERACRLSRQTPIPGLSMWKVDARPSKSLILDPNEFTFLHRRKRCRCHPTMRPKWCRSIGRLVGEFRVHYAGFFDFSAPEGKVRAPSSCSREVRLILVNRRATRVREDACKAGKIIRQGIGSNYQAQSLKLS